MKELNKYYIKDIIVDDELENEFIDDEMDKTEDLNNASSEIDRKGIKTYKRNKQIKPFTYFTKKEFEKFRAENSIKIIGNVYLNKERKEEPEESKEPEELKESEDYNKTNDKDKKTKKSKRKNKNKSKKEIVGILNADYSEKFIEKHQLESADSVKSFNIYKENNTKCIGYAWVGDKNYVRLCKRNYFFIIFIILLILAGIILGVHSCVNGTNPLKPIANTEDYQKEDSDIQNAAPEQTTFRGFDKLYVEKANPNITLDNPKGNTVYFKYSIYLDDTNSGSVDLSKDKPIYETRWIAPGKMEKADLYSVLEKGTHTLFMIVETRDIDTKEECVGTTFSDVSILAK